MGEYLYCIIGKKNPQENFAIKGIGNSELRCVNYRDLTAVTGETPLREYEPTEEYTEKHKEVSLHILENHTVLPVAFGMVFKRKGILLNTMRRVYPVLKRSLRLIDNKIELGVKVIVPKDKSINKEEVKKKCEAAFGILNKISVQSKLGKLFSDRLVSNMSFLVDRSKIDEFSDMVTKLEKKYKNLKVQYTGPWPPYNFVDIKIMGRGR